MGFAEQGRTGGAASQAVIPALRRDPLWCRKNAGEGARLVRWFRAAQAWTPAQGRGDDLVVGVTPERRAP